MTFTADIRQTGNRPTGRVAMERRKEEVPRHRRLQRSIGRLVVTDFTNHDDVGVVSQQRP